jgi:hypothetical protein
MLKCLVLLAMVFPMSHHPRPPQPPTGLPIATYCIFLSGPPPMTYCWSLYG